MAMMGIDSLAVLLRRLGRMLKHDQLARQLDEELAFHADMLARDERRRGLPDADARARAQRRLGNRTRIREEARDTWSVELLDRTAQDLRYALRGIRSRPLFAVTVVITLALGIGANTAVFSLVNWLLIQPVPAVRDASRLVTVRFGSTIGEDRAWFPVSYPVFEDVKGESRTLRDIAAYEPADIHVAGTSGAGAWRAGAEIVSPNYFAVLGVRPRLGRVFSPNDAIAIGSHDEVVISDRAWHSAFAADSAVVGRAILVNARPAVVIGVAPPGFLGPQVPGATDYWVPVSMHPRILPDYLPTKLLQERKRGTFLFQLVGRMRDDASASAVQSELTLLHRRLTSTAGSQPSADEPAPVVFAGLGLAEFERGRVRGIVSVLGAVVVLVLLTACANTANLLLARGVTRRHEMAIRRAIGAGRARLVRQQVTECLVFAALGATVALALAWTLMRVIANVRLVSSMPPLGDVPLDWRVLLFTLGCTVLTTALFGMVPAVVSTRAVPQAALRAGALRTHAGTRLRGALMVAQMALSLVLLVGAGLFVRTLVNLRGVRLGIDVAPVITTAVDLSAQGYDDSRARTFFRDLLAGLERERGITAASVVWLPPFGRGAADAGVWRAGRDSATVVDARANMITPGFFRVTGIAVTRGRTFRQDELFRTDSAAVSPVIVSASLARKLFGAIDPLGQRLRRKYRGPNEYEVVGVVAEARTVNVAQASAPYLYEPLGESFLPKRVTLMVRGDANAVAAVAAMRRVARSLDATLPLFDVRSLAAQVESQLFEQIAVARLTTLFASVAVLLAAVGLYGLMSFVVSDRTREFGIRAALGARSRSLVAPVVRSAAVLGLMGIVAGTGVSVALAGLVRSRLYGVEPLDVPTFVGAAALLALVALASTIVPAWRVARVDPLVALRRE
jgi:predicted permease